MWCMGVSQMSLPAAEGHEEHDEARAGAGTALPPERYLDREGYFGDARSSEAPRRLEQTALDVYEVVRRFEEHRVVRGMEASGQMAVLKTGPANAHPVAFAFDNASFPEIIGTIAGDDTLALIAREPHTGHDLIRLIERLQEETP